jgi:hypothetical protein
VPQTTPQLNRIPHFDENSTLYPRGYAKTSYGVCKIYENNYFVMNTEYSGARLGGMPETSSMISLTGQNHMNNLQNI